MLDGQVNVGSSVSLTVTVKVQALVLPLASVAVQVTVVTPLLNVLPLAGLQVTVPPEQLSVKEGVKFTVRVQAPAEVFVMIFAGHIATGTWLSVTLTVNVQAFVLPPASVAVQVTVVTPLLKLLPLAGKHATVEPGQLSLAVGVM